MIGSILSNDKRRLVNPLTQVAMASWWERKSSLRLVARIFTRRKVTASRVHSSLIKNISSRKEPQVEPSPPERWGKFNQAAKFRCLSYSWMTIVTTSRKIIVRTPFLSLSWWDMRLGTSRVLEIRKRLIYLSCVNILTPEKLTRTRGVKILWSSNSSSMRAASSYRHKILCIKSHLSRWTIATRFNRYMKKIVAKTNLATKWVARICS